MNNYKSAKGMRGVFLQTQSETIFRVYNKDGFVDYNVNLDDMQIIIDDDDAFVYNDEYIDYSKETLGND